MAALETRRPWSGPLTRPYEDTVPDWQKDLRMVVLWATGLHLWLAYSVPELGVIGAAILAIIWAVPAFLLVRWFAFLNEHLGAWLAVLLAGILPAVLGAINVGVFDAWPSFFQRRGDLGLVGVGLVLSLFTLG